MRAERSSHLILPLLISLLIFVEEKKEIVKLLVLNLPPSSCHVLSVRSKCFPLQFVPKQEYLN
jgi:hypothetical protein